MTNEQVWWQEDKDRKMGRRSSPRLANMLGYFLPWFLGRSSSLAVALVPLAGLQAQSLNLPPRPSGALTGSQFINVITPMSLTERENWIYAQVVSGNVPDLFRTLAPVSVSAAINRTNH